MKTIATIFTFCLIATGTASFANTEINSPEINANVPVAPSVWTSADIDAPESLKFLKAKNAFVPVADFVWGNPEQSPSEILTVPVAPFIFGEPGEFIPEIS